MIEYKFRNSKGKIDKLQGKMGLFDEHFSATHPDRFWPTRAEQVVSIVNLENRRTHQTRKVFKTFRVLPTV